MFAVIKTYFLKRFLCILVDQRVNKFSLVKYRLKWPAQYRI